MIALVLSSHWPRYYASSPFLNLFKARHPKFKLFAIQPHELQNQELMDEVCKCEVLVTDDINAHMLKGFPGLKLMIGGDPHAHRLEQVKRLELEYSCVDYVLTGAVFCKRLTDRYMYPPAELWNKHLYFPHMVPDERPEVMAWQARDKTTLLSGSRDPAVYPFRAACNELAKSHRDTITNLEMNNFHHQAYFELVGRYRAAITCPSVFEYLVAKYMEIPWLGTILIAPALTNEECELIGFMDGLNCFWVKSPEEVAIVASRYQQASGEELLMPCAMADKGARLMERHTAYLRLDYITKLVERIEKGNFVPEDAKDCFLKHRTGG